MYIFFFVTHNILYVMHVDLLTSEHIYTINHEIYTLSSLDYIKGFGFK